MSFTTFARLASDFPSSLLKMLVSLFSGAMISGLFAAPGYSPTRPSVGPCTTPPSANFCALMAPTCARPAADASPASAKLNGGIVEERAFVTANAVSIRAFPIAIRCSFRATSLSIASFLPASSCCSFSVSAALPCAASNLAAYSSSSIPFSSSALARCMVNILSAIVEAVLIAASKTCCFAAFSSSARASSFSCASWRF